MKKRTSATARILAALALAGAVIAVVILVPAALKDNSSKGSKNSANHAAKHEPTHKRTKAKTYEVQTGDTLISIAHQTGVPVAEILALNPEVDPQILIAGETLKLR
ncbi:MAG: LysM domain [Solirubrobacterales bacterium]|jgi:LysM repeat protein|nr:LysM domain [Solirubrobacterales bacterium]